MINQMQSISFTGQVQRQLHERKRLLSSWFLLAISIHRVGNMNGLNGSSIGVGPTGVSTSYRPTHHSRHSSVGSSLQTDSASYVRQLRMAKATVWAEKGPKDAVSDSRKNLSSSQKKSRFGMKIFNSSNTTAPSAQYVKPQKTKLRLYAAPQHTTLVPRLSASEANDGDDFTNFTSSTYVNDKRASNAPSLARSSLQHTRSQTDSIHKTHSIHNIDSAPSSPNRPAPRADFTTASGASSSIDADAALTASSRRTLSQSQFMFPSTTHVTTSRSGSPTQLQQYTTHHNPSDSDDEDREPEVRRPKLFIANADISDSD